MPSKPTAILNSYILLDRSGSMQSQWKEAVNSINAYVEELIKDGPEDTVTLAAFDTNTSVGGLSMQYIDKGTKLKNWRALTDTEITPRGGTPLYDAVGSLIAQINSDKPERAVIVIMTDGEENQSREYNVTSAKAALEAQKAKGFQVIFLGANFDNARQSATLGGTYAGTIQASAAGLESTLRSTAKSARLYSTTGADMSYSAQDRADAMAGTVNHTATATATTTTVPPDAQKVAKRYATSSKTT